ncbi:cohesin domain-containing protein [Candidatus Poribacteria bacterium]
MKKRAKSNHILYCLCVIINLMLMVCMADMSFAEEDQTIIVTVGAGGSVTPSGTVTVPYGGKQLFEIYPDPGYAISAIILNGDLREFGNIPYPIDTPKFNYQLSSIRRDCTLEIQFVQIYLVITATAGEGGSIYPSGNVVVSTEADQSFSVSVSAGYYISDVKVDGVSQDGTGPGIHSFSYTFENVVSAHTIEAIFTSSTIIITPEVQGDGSISLLGPTSVPVSSSLACTIAPNFCQKIKDILVDGDSVMDSAPSPDTLIINLATGRATYTFNQVVSDHTITAIFEELDPIIVEAKEGSGIEIDPDDEMEIGCRGVESFTIISPYDHQGTVFSAKMSLQVDASLKWDVPDLELSSSLESADKFTVNLEPANNLSDTILFPLEITIEPDGHWSLDTMKVENQWVSIASPQWPGSAPDTMVTITDDAITITNPLFRYGMKLTFEIRSRTVTSTVSAGDDGLSHGEITPTGSNVVEDGEDMTFTIEPDDCYQIGDVVVTRFTEEITPISVMDELVLNPQAGAGTYTLSDIQSDCEIDVTFDRIYYIVVTSVTPDGGGTILPGSDSAGEAAVPCGADQTFEIKPEDNYWIKNVKVDGESIVQTYDKYIALNYTLEDVSEDHTVEAEFQRYYTITVTPGHGGSVISTTHTIDATGDARVGAGETAQFYVSSDTGYYIETIMVDDVPVADLGTPTTEYTQTFSGVSADHTIVAIFAKYYTITATAGTGGTVIPQGTTMAHEGADQRYTFAPDDCYEVVDVVINGVSSGPLPEYTFEEVSEDATIHVDFAKKTYTITARAWVNGAIEPSGRTAVNCGENATFTITPDPCHKINDVTISQGGEEPVSVIDGVNIDPTTRIGTYEFSNVQSNYIVNATFAVLGPFIAIATVEGDGGTISPETTQVACGKDLSITITPDDCYVIDDVKVDRGNGGPVSVVDAVITDTETGIGTYTLEDVTGNCIVYANFSKLGPFTVIASVTTANGIISPSGTMQIACGEDRTFSITPADCYEIGDVEVIQGTGEPASVMDDVDIDPTTRAGTYILGDIRSDYTIEVTVSERDPFTVTTAVGPGGGGKIKPDGDSEGNVTVPCGADQTFEVKPGEGYYIKEITIDGGVAEQGSYDTYSKFQHTFADVMSDHTIAVVFQRYYVISVTATDGGSVSPTTGDVRIDEGETIQFQISAAPGHHIETLLVDGSPVADLEAYSTDYTQTFTAVSADHTIGAVFVKYYSITVTSGTGGTIIPADSSMILAGTDQKYTIKPDRCYEIEDVVINGVSSGPLSEYTFVNLSEGSTIHVTFAQKVITVTVQTTDGGTVGPTQDGGAIGLEAGEFQLELPCDEKWTLNVAPADGYSFRDMAINGESMFLSEDEAPVDETELELRVGEPLEGSGALSPQSYSYSIREEASNPGKKITIDFQAPNSYDIGITFVESNTIPGDIDGDGRASAGDAILALRIAAKVMTPTEKQRNAADMNGDGEVTAIDAVLILRKAIGLAAPGMDSMASGGGQVDVMLADVHGVAGESIIVPVRVDNVGLLAGGDISIGYDSSVLRAVDVLSGTDALLASNVDEPGTVRIAFAGSSKLSGKTLAKIRFDIIADDVSPLSFMKADLYRPDTSLLDARKVDGRFESWGIPPESNALLQNFPNPFNPDTWIPYQLKEGSAVTIQIFSVHGELVREFNLGYRSAGSYVSQDRAVHWNGKNENGEQVASGIYFYSLRTSDFIMVRKLTILQ